MFRKLLAVVLAAAAFNVLAAVDANRATQAELEQLRGVGPQLSTRILTAREARPFSDWDDLRRRVTGLGPAQSARLSREGLTVAGAAFAATDSMLTPRKKSQTPTAQGR